MACARDVQDYTLYTATLSIFVTSLSGCPRADVQIFLRDLVASRDTRVAHLDGSVCSMSLDTLHALKEVGVSMGLPRRTLAS